MRESPCITRLTGPATDSCSEPTIEISEIREYYDGNPAPANVIVKPAQNCVHADPLFPGSVGDVLEWEIDWAARDSWGNVSEARTVRFKVRFEADPTPSCAAARDVEYFRR